LFNGTNLELISFYFQIFFAITSYFYVKNTNLIFLFIYNRFLWNN